MTPNDEIVKNKACMWVKVKHRQVESLFGIVLGPCHQRSLQTPKAKHLVLGLLIRCQANIDWKTSSVSIIVMKAYPSWATSLQSLHCMMKEAAVRLASVSSIGHKRHLIIAECNWLDTHQESVTKRRSIIICSIIMDCSQILTREKVTW